MDVRCLDTCHELKLDWWDEQAILTVTIERWITIIISDFRYCKLILLTTWALLREFLGLVCGPGCGSPSWFGNNLTTMRPSCVSKPAFVMWKKHQPQDMFALITWLCQVRNLLCMFHMPCQRPSGQEMHWNVYCLCLYSVFLSVSRSGFLLISKS